MAIWYCTAFPLLLCGTASIVSYRRHGMALYRLTHGALTVQPVLYLTVGMVWHCTVLLLMLCTASIVSYRRHGMALYRLTHGARYSHLTVGMAAVWHCTVLLLYRAIASIVSYPGHGMASYRLTPGTLGSFIQCILGYDTRTPLQVDLCFDQVLLLCVCLVMGYVFQLAQTAHNRIHCYYHGNV